MATYTLDQYQKLWRQRAAKLRRKSEVTARDAALHMEAAAKGMAPEKTGALRAGITHEKIKPGQYEVSSSVPGGFPYQFWINQTAPFRSLKMIWNSRQPTVYGDGTHFNTGTPRYWHFATLRTKEMFAKTALKNTRSVFKSAIG